MPARLDLRYPSVDGRTLSWDFFPAEPLAPCVVCIHGGGWISGEPSMMHDVAECLNRAGFSAACPEYRLAPLHPYPAAIEDVRAFVQYLNHDAPNLGIDPNSIASLGNSAGGHLASILGFGFGEVPRVAAVVDICGISDLTDPHGQHFPISHGFLEQFMGDSFVGSEEKWRDASPIFHVTSDSAPFLIVHGENDDVVPIGQSEALAGKLFANGVEVEFHRLPGEGHAFTYQGWSRIESLFCDFLSRTLKHGSVA